MILFHIKSAACMAIFLMFYKLFLEKESMHFFKRYFLLAAIAISLVIPAVVFTEVIYIEPISTSFTPTEDYSLETYHAPNIESIDYTYWSLLSIYGLGVLFFSLQFFKNLYQIKNTIQNNPKQQTNSIIKVLLSLQIVPHTFFNYIFLNKQKFEANEIPPAVLLHEETHAKQKHSIDILVLEILQIVFWFNPLIYLFKKSIKLNHEFLADSAVLNNGLEKSDYQKILLAFSSNAAEPQLANAINYSSIKKRFTVMKKETSRKVSLVKSFLIIPIAAILLLGFSEKEILEIQKEGSAQEQQTLLSGIKKELENVNALKLNYTDTHDIANNNSNLKNFEFQISRINQGLRLESMIGSNWKELELNLPNNQPQLINKSGLVKSNNNGGIKNSQDFLISIQKTEKEIFLKGLSGTGWVELSFTLSENGRQKVNQNGMITSKEENDAREEAILKYNSLAKKYNTIPIEKRVIPLKDLKILETIYGIMSLNEREEAQPFPECLPKKNQEYIIKLIQININKKGQLLVQDDLVALEDLQEYLSKINTQLSIDEKKKMVKSIIQVDRDTPNDIIKKVEQNLIKSGVATIDIVEYNYSLKKTTKIATSAQLAQYNQLSKKYNTMMAKDGNIRIVKSDVDQLKHIYGLMSEEQKASAQPFPDFPEPPRAPQVPEAQNEREEAAKTIKRIIEEQDPYDTNTLTRIEPSVVNSPKAPMAPIFLKDGKFYQSEVAVDKSNTIKINGEKHYYINDNGTSRIYNRFGQRVTNNGQIIDVNEQPIEIIEVVEVPSAPEPPTPPSPLDYVINAAKKGATLMYEGKIVSSDKAIDLLKNNKELNIESRNKNGKQIVRITKDPVTIE